MKQELTAQSNQNSQATELQNSPENKQVSELCSNCYTELNGPFCHNCGQSSRSMIKFFGALFREVTEDVIGYDSRLRHTIIPLLFKPGKITNDYIKDRRFYYVLPLRLYLITSVIFILVLKFNTNTENMVITDSDEQGAVTVVDDNNPTANNKSSSLEKGRPEDVSTLEQQENSELTDSNPAEDKDSEEDSSDFGIQIDGDELNFKGDEFKQGFLKDFADELKSKWAAWQEDPQPMVKQLVSQVFELLPYMMFVLLPIFALVLKLFYMFSNRYYVEHLIFLIHNHSFIYVALMLDMGLDHLDDNFSNSANSLIASLASFAGFAGVLLAVWIVAYIFISMRRVYNQGWALTILKGVLLGVIYFSLISFGFVTIVLVGAYLA